MFAAIFDAQFLIAVAAALGAGIIHGFAGFGVGFILVPVLTFVFGPVEAVAISSSASVVASLPLIPSAAWNMDRTEVLPILASLLIAVPLGAYLLTLADPEIMRRTSGGLVVISALLMLRGYQWTGQRTQCAGNLVGSLAVRQVVRPDLPAGGAGAPRDHWRGHRLVVAGL